jgi:hypothetical protein
MRNEAVDISYVMYAFAAVYQEMPGTTNEPVANSEPGSVALPGFKCLMPIAPAC